METGKQFIMPHNIVCRHYLITIGPQYITVTSYERREVELQLFRQRLLGARMDQIFRPALTRIVAGELLTTRRRLIAGDDKTRIVITTCDYADRRRRRSSVFLRPSNSHGRRSA